ncbi:MAG: VOC family protein [Acidimicrobiales bacterium]|nr:VOC family protein [Actinomycetota bacterium]
MPLRDHAPLGAPCYIDLMSSDPDRTVAFYGDLFGWVGESGGPEYGGYINLSKDGVAVAGCMASDGSNGPSNVWCTYLAVADADATMATAEANGAMPIVPPMDIMDLGRMGFLADPGGAAIGIWQPGSFAGTGVLGEPGTPAWFELHTRDYDASLAFYRTVFGWDTETMGDTSEFRYTTVKDGEEQVAGVMDSTAHLPEGIPAHWAVYFGTEDADATVARAVELGGAVTQPAEDTPYGRLAALTDATGTNFRLLGPNVG